MVCLDSKRLEKMMKSVFKTLIKSDRVDPIKKK